MTHHRSRRSARFRHSRRSDTIRREPPTHRSIPSSDEQVEDQGSDDLRWGHQMGKKPEGMIRVVLQNVDGIPHNKQGDMKLDSLRLFTEEQEIDIMAMTELNTAWDCLEYNDRLPAKTRGWWEANHWSVTHNKQDKQGDTFQPGGAALVVLNALSHKTTQPGDDTTGLGRWCWVRI